MSTDPDGRRSAARRALAEAVWTREAVKKLSEGYPKDRPPDPDLAEALTRVLDTAVRQRVAAARAAGIGTTEPARIAGVGRSRIIRILHQERDQ
jgi:hypothetical protein